MPTQTVEIQQPVTELDALALAGNSFSERMAASRAPKGEEQTETQDEPPGTPDGKPAEKQPKAKPAKEEKPAGEQTVPVKKSTPFDISKPEEAAPEKPEEDTELKKALETELPANASANAKSSHAALRKGYEREHARVKELLEQNEALKKQAPASSADLENQLKAEREARQKMEQELERASFERSPKYQRFESEIQAELAAARSYVEGTDINPDVIDLASRMKGAKRLSVLTESGLDGSQIAAITSCLARGDAVTREREAAQADWKGTHAQWEAEQRQAAEKQAAQVREQEDRVFQSVGKRMTETIPAWNTAEGNDEWNADREKRWDHISKGFNGKLPLDETCELLYKGGAFDVTEAARIAAVKEVNDLRAEVKRLKAASPGASSGSSSERNPMASTGDFTRDSESTFKAMQAKHAQRAA